MIRRPGGYTPGNEAARLATPPLLRGIGLHPFGETPRTGEAHITGTHLKGTAHDFSARLLGGTCGIAGAFSTLADLSRFLQHMLAPTQAAFGQPWIADSLRIRTGELIPARGLFWHPAPDTELRDDIWVHYGFTATGMWASPKQQRWAVLLTNKLYFTRDREPLTAVRDALRRLAFLRTA